jgi:shikimate kinase
MDALDRAAGSQAGAAAHCPDRPFMEVSAAMSKQSGNLLGGAAAAVAGERPASAAEAIREALGSRSIVLVGMMGAGKTSVGRRLSQRLGMPFADADAEIERAAGMSIPEIFTTHGEESFRTGERRVVARLLDAGPQVLATGGGAWINAETRERVRQSGVAVWLKADLDVLMRRVRKRSNRPLLRTEDPEATMRALIAERYPVYALADITVVSLDAPHDAVVDEILGALAVWLGGRKEEAC